MRIIYDHQIFCLQEYGGVSRYVYELALELSVTYAQDLKIVSPLYINRYLKGAYEGINLIGIPLGYIPKIGGIIGEINSILTCPIMLYQKPEIVHETYYSSRRVAPKSAKVILTVHDMIHEKFCQFFSKSDPTSRNKAIAVARADHIICVSENTRQDLIEFLDVDPSKTSVVHHGFSLREQNNFESKIITLERPFLLYVGSRKAYKNFNGLIHAYASSNLLKNNFDLISFGGGPFSFREKSELKKLGLTLQNIRQVSGDDALLSHYYKSAVAFIYPSLYEGFGIPPLEAMSFDCPVICSEGGSIPEIVGNAGEFFNPYEPSAIRMSIERIVSNSHIRQSLIARGREQFKLFSWKRCAKKTLDVYRKVLLK
jgi:glycosyltransferase involved in cell wall biosynthesis